MKRHLVAALALGAVLLSGAVLAQPTPTYPNVTYAVLGTRALQLDLYLPGGAGPFPVVVWVHGGGWSSGSRYPIPAGPAALLSRGIAVASVSYRLTSQAGQWGTAPVIFPAQIHDVKGAVRFLRARATTYRLDPNRFGVWGSSAGGHLAALLGTSGGVAALDGSIGGNTGVSSRVQAAADYFGPTNLLAMNDDVTNPPGSSIDHDAPSSPESRLIGWSGSGQGLADIKANLTNPNPPYPELRNRLFLANPISHVTADDPPFFIGHGTADTSVPLKQSTRLADALTAAGVPRDYRIVQGAGHGSLGSTTDSAAVNFFAARLGGTP